MLTLSPLRKKFHFGKKKEKRHQQKDISFTVSSSSSSTTTSSPPPPPPGSFPSQVPPPLSKESFPTANNGIKLSPPTLRLPVVDKKQEKDKHKVTVRPPKQKEQHHSTSSRRSHSTNNKDEVAAAAALDTVGNALLEKGDYNRAIKSYERALQLKRASLRKLSSSKDNEELLASVATSINNIGYLRQRSGDASPQESMAAYQDSLKIKRDILGNNSLSVGKTLNNIGSVHYSSRNYAQALRCYTEAKDIMQHNLGEYHLDVATVFSNIGDVYMAQSLRKLAHVEYKHALEIRWMHLKEHDAKIRRLLEKIAIIEMNQEMVDNVDANDDDEENRMLEEEEDLPVQTELHNLHEQVEADIKEVTFLRRKMALDMVKDKLRILKGMRNIDNDDDDDGSLEENDEIAEKEEVKQTPPPLSPKQRSEALSSVKERLSKIREQRSLRSLMEEEESIFSPSMAHGEDDDARIERELGLEHLALPKLNLDSILDDL